MTKQDLIDILGGLMLVAMWSLIIVMMFGL